MFRIAKFYRLIRIYFKVLLHMIIYIISTSLNFGPSAFGRNKIVPKSMKFFLKPYLLTYLRFLATESTGAPKLPSPPERPSTVPWSTSTMHSSGHPGRVKIIIKFILLGKTGTKQQKQSSRNS